MNDLLIDITLTPVTPEILKHARRASQKNILFLPHAITQMSRPDRMLEPSEIRKVIRNGVLVEEYRDDQRS
ncbi:MAG TPA: hypothetical protein VJ044_06795 [Candidatus Hodarchaeales archaeon]|nr:hypothetical protein [Candidatus Hodarchaeales archaeon]